MTADIEELDTPTCQLLSALRRKWRKEGRCPHCGELGRFITFQPVCSLHGPYSTAPFSTESAFDNGDLWKKE